MAAESLHIYPETALHKLHFDKVLGMLLADCLGGLGRMHLERSVFHTNAERLRNELHAVAELHSLLGEPVQLPHTGFDELTFLNKFGIVNYALNEAECCTLYVSLQASASIRAALQRQDRAERYPILTNWSGALPDGDEAAQAIARVLDLELKRVKETASPELGRIRQAMHQVQQQVQAAFRRSLSQYKALDYLAETEETIRNGRRVLSVRSEYKRSVKGMMVDESHNGTITYIEPESTVILNNDVVALEHEESREIHRILLQLTDSLRPERESFGILQEALGYWDAWQAKAHFARRFRAVLPELSVTPRLYLKDFRNPVLEQHLAKQHKAVVPNTLDLDAENRILVISGPNAGGKSVILKSAGLLQLIFQFGLLVPAEEGSVMSVFRELFIDIDDDQSIENDVSTYSSHLQKMRHFVLNAGKRSLVLLDEMGVGTDPALGGAMAEAVLQVLHDKGAMGVVTTHFHNLKVYAAQTPGMLSAAMAFDRKELRPLYTLLPGQPGSSFTFEIAQKTGMPREVIELARERAGENKKALDDTLAEMQVEKQFLRGIRKNVQKQEEQLSDLVLNYQQLKKELERDKKKLRRQYEQQMLDRYNENSRELERLMREWREDRSDRARFDHLRQHIDEKRAELEHRLDTEPAPAEDMDAGEIRIGSLVRMENGQETGVVREIRKDIASVAFGQLMTKVKLNRLVAVSEPKQTKHTSVQAVNTLAARSTFELELDIRGLLKDEAFTALENFLDRAVMFGTGKVRILHGRGTGALRQAVQTYLKKYPYVKTFYPEQEFYGGNGVTIVEMK